MIDIVRRAVIFDSPSAKNAKAMQSVLENNGYDVSYAASAAVIDALANRKSVTGEPMEFVVCAPSDGELKIQGKSVKDFILRSVRDRNRVLPVILYPAEGDHKAIDAGLLKEYPNVQSTSIVDYAHVQEAYDHAMEETRLYKNALVGAQSGKISR